MTSIKKTLLEIQETQSFEQLEPFTSPEIWTAMTQGEKDLFSILLLRWGAKQLEKGNLKVVSTFSLAAELSSQPSDVLYQQGLLFAGFPNNSRCLDWAYGSFLKTLEKESFHFMALYHLANVCVARGLLHDEHSYFLEADTHFQNAEILFPACTTSNGVSKELFYHAWGTCLFLIGKHSGEPVDFYRSIHQYELALEAGYKEPQFLDDYARALTHLASLLDREEIFLTAIKFYEVALKAAPNFSACWNHYADCLLKLSESSTEEAYFDHAGLIFERAIELDGDNGQLWLKWGQLEVCLGKFKQNYKSIESSIQKFKRADELEPNHHFILCCWADAELFLGSHRESLDLLQSAKEKILRSIEIQPENADSWYVYGCCLNEMGCYFDDAQFYHRAIEQFNYGLSLNSQSPLIWYGLALSHFALGDMNDDLNSFEECVRYCSKVIESGAEVFPQFWNDWGVALMKIAELTDRHAYLEMAIEKFEKAFSGPLDSEYDNVDLEWVYNYGCALDLLGDMTEDASYFEKAVTVLTKVVQLDHSYRHARYNLGLALSHLGEMIHDIDCYAKAMEHFQILLEQDSEDELVHLDFSILLINLSLLIYDAHHPEPSEGLYRQAEFHLTHAISLGNCLAFYQLAGLYSLTSRYSLAINYLERAYFAGILPEMEDLMHDDWLDGLRTTQAFRDFLNFLSRQNSKDDI